MKIIYSPFYDNDPYLGDAPKEMGTTYVGNLGLLNQLQLRAGMHLEATPDVEREASYLNAMLKHSTGQFFENAAKVDQIGVAGKLLQWRDALVMAGWNGTCNDQGATKIQALAEIEKDFSSIGIADCWKAVCEKYTAGVSLGGEVESIRVDTAKTELPYLIQKTLDAIQAKGIEVRYISDENPEQPRLDPAKIKYVEFDDLNDAYEWFAQISELPEKTVVVNRDNVRLNHTLYTWDKPLSHSSLKNSNPQLLQLFKLSMSIFSRPLNIKNLVSYLMLPKSPIPAALRYALAKQLMTHGGFGDKIIRADGKLRDDWDEIIETFPFRGKDGKDSAQAIGVAKAKKMPFLTPIREDYSSGISKSDLTEYVKNLRDWARGHYADDTLPAGIKAQLRELSDYLSSFNTALESFPESIEYNQIEKLILRLYRPMNYSLQSAQNGSANIVNDVRAIAADAGTLLWLDCQEDDIEKDPYDFLSAAERQYLEKHKCSLPDFSAHLQTCRKERLRAMDKCKSIILVRSKYDGTTRLGEHPMVAEARYEYKASGNELLPIDPSKLFTAVSPTSATKKIEKFQPVKALELGDIDYHGRKESYSSLESLIQLPFNYLMQYVAKLPVPDDEQLTNLYITTGLVAHHFFEHVTKDALAKGSTPPLAEMQRLVDTEFEKRLEAAIDATGLIMRLPENSPQLEQFKTQLKESILALIEIMQTKGWTPVGCEMEFPQSGNGPLNLKNIGNFGARIDYLAKDKDGKYVIIDFKWSYSKKYEEHLSANTAIQLELYRQTVLETYKGADVAGVAYYLMPRKQLLTTDFNEIPNSRLISHIDKGNANNLFAQIQNSYKFRMGEIRKGHIEEAEMMVVSGDANGYYDNVTSGNLCPLDVDEKYTRRGDNRTLVSATKKSEQIYSQKKKQTFEDQKTEPSEKATSHPILKGRLK